MQEHQGFTSPIPKLDHALGSHLRPGNFILCAGLTGAGKTILAGQLAANMALAGHQVFYISTEVTHEALDSRLLSAFCDIPHAHIMDRMITVSVPFRNGEMNYPDPVHYGRAATEKSIPLKEALYNNFAFAKIRSLGFQPAAQLDTLVAEYVERHGKLPAMMIYDYLSNPSFAHQSEIDPFKARKAVRDAANALAALAKTHNVLVLAFCQADPSLVTNKKIAPENIAEFREIREVADAFIGISKRVRADIETVDSEEIYNRVQHLTVSTRTNPASILVPVSPHFAYQRFEPYDGRAPISFHDRCGLERIAKDIAARSNFRGYVLASREKLREVFTCGVPYAISLYTFLMLVADEEGSSFYGRKTQARALGLSDKRLRTALDLFEDRAWVGIGDAPHGRSLQATLLDWEKEQCPRNPGYFKLLRNLRDKSRADILGNPIILRVWLYLLSEARTFEDEAAELVAGEVLVRLEHLQDTVQVGYGEYTDAMDRLQRRGSIRLSKIDEDRVTITNWNLYQNVIYPRIPRSGSVKVDSETSRQATGTPKASSGQAEGNVRATK